MLIFAWLLAQAAPAPAAPAPPPETPLSAITTPSGLRFEILQAGTGRRPGAGDAVLVTYVGRLADGRVFDSAAQPVGLSVSGAIPGFTEKDSGRARRLRVATFTVPLLLVRELLLLLRIRRRS